MNNPKFQIFKSAANSQYYYRLKAVNGETILGSEGYTSKQNCTNAIASVNANAPYDSRYERKDGLTSYTFNLKTNNGEIIGKSEPYTIRVARENGIAAVKRYALIAGVEDLT